MGKLQKRIIVRLHDSDAAGLLFFARQFYMAHDIYEDLLKHIGFPIIGFIENESFFVPIVHSESQYFRPLATGDLVDITLTIANIGNTSYTLEYEFATAKGEPVGKAKTIHCTVSKETKEKIAIPAHFRGALEKFQREE